MNIRQALEKCLSDWKNISKLDFCLLTLDFQPVVSTCERKLPAFSKLQEFIDSSALCIAGKSVSIFRICDQEQLTNVLLIWGNPDQIGMIGELAVCQVESLIEAYAQKNNKNTFIQRLLLGEISSIELYNQAQRLHIADQAQRVIFIIQTHDAKDTSLIETVRNIFSKKSHDFITSLDSSKLIIIHELEINEDYEALTELATIIIDMLGSEVMISAKVSLSTIAETLSDLSNAYKEAYTAMEIGTIFYADTAVYSYNRLGIGRLIYQLPLSICELFINEIYQGDSLESLDAETLNIIRTFFENNLNLSETSRNLYVHRNSLVYRFEKIQKKYGLDLRSFEDALTFKISMMVTDYIRHHSK